MTEEKEKEEENRAFNRERRKLRRTVVRVALEWSKGRTNEEPLLTACQALRGHLRKGEEA